MPYLYYQQNTPVKAELTELKPVTDPSLTMHTTMHTTMGIPNLAPAPQVQQPSYEMMRPSAATPSQTFIAVPSANLVQASHPMASGQGYTMRLSDHTQSSVSNNSSSAVFSSVGQSIMTMSPSQAVRKYFTLSQFRYYKCSADGKSPPQSSYDSPVKGVLFVLMFFILLFS